jgi:hypothetical protein
LTCRSYFPSDTAEAEIKGRQYFRTLGNHEAMRQNLYQACISATEQSITSRAATYNRAIVTARYPLYGGRRNSMKTSIIHKYIIFLISRSARKIVRFVVCNPTAVNSLRIGRRLGDMRCPLVQCERPSEGTTIISQKPFRAGIQNRLSLLPQFRYTRPPSLHCQFT